MMQAKPKGGTLSAKRLAGPPRLIAGSLRLSALLSCLLTAESLQAQLLEALLIAPRRIRRDGRRHVRNLPRLPTLAPAPGTSLSSPCPGEGCRKGSSAGPTASFGSPRAPLAPTQSRR